MKPTALTLLMAVVVAVVVVVVLKPTHDGASPSPTTSVTTTNTLPRLLDLGANKCIPCQMMVPILKDLADTYAGSLRVDFIDVWDHKEAAETYRISTIPTQIFFSADGKEIFRHEGFFAKEDILAQWKTLGYDLKPTVNPQHDR